MASGGDFEPLLRSQVEALQGRLLAEHRLVVGRLEAKIATLEEEKQRLLPKPPVPREELGECLLGGAPVQKGTCLQKADRRQSWGPPTRCGEEEVPGRQLASEIARGAAKDSHAPERRTSWGLTTCCEEVPNVLSPADEMARDRSPANDMSGVPCFRVLELWERSLDRAKSRRISHVSSMTLHSFDDRCSSTSHSLSTGFTSKSSYADLDAGCEGEQPNKRLVEAWLQPWMLHPSSLRYLCWELLGLALVAHDIVMVPLQTLRPHGGAFTSAMSWLIRIFWTFDILVSFMTGYVSPQGLIELRPAKVARRYARSRLAFDVALVSVDWVEAFIEAFRGGQDASALRLVGMLRALRLVRLVRLIKSQKIFEFIFEHIRSEGVKLVAYIISIMVVLLCLIHVIACIWHGIHSAGAMDAEEESGLLAERYFEAFHYVLSLFAGEQLLEPGSLLERIFTILVLIFAFVVSAAFVGSLTTAMTQLQVIASKRSSQFASLNRYLSDHGISRQLSSRVQRNARHALKEQKRHTPESSVELMALISDPLRSEIRYEVYSPLLTAHPFFYLYNAVNPVGVRHICHTAVHSVSLSRGDVIFSEFEVPVSPRMFFVVSGRLVYVRGADGSQNVTARQWVAEAVLWTQWAHRGTLRAITESRLLSVDVCRVANIMSTFPTLHGINYAERFVQDLNVAGAERELSDIPDGGEALARSRAATVFQELDRTVEIPAEWLPQPPRRSSTFSVGSLVSSRRFSSRSSKRSTVTALAPVGHGVMPGVTR